MWFLLIPEGGFMLNIFQVAAEAVGASVKRFTVIGDAVSYVQGMSGGSPVSTSYLPPELREAFSGTVFASPGEAADTRLCVSFARAAIAATGTLFLELSDPKERGATALPLIHVVFLKASTIVADLYALQGLIADGLSSSGTAYLSLTTGPSRTADIERVLTIGVHGPKELHVLVLEGE
jgi:L-lactate dehydrogenase complex protein LldG